MNDIPRLTRGPIINYLRLLPLFVKEGYETHLLSIYVEDYPNARSLSNQGVIVHSILQTDTLTLVNWILNKAEEIQPDIFVPDLSVPGCFAGKYIQKSGVPVITTHRSDDKNNWGRAIYFTDLTYKYNLTGIVCVSDYLKNTLIDKISKTHSIITVIPSGVEIPVSIANQNQSYLNIVYSGRFVEKQKKVNEMMTSFLVLCSKFDKIKFTLIGNGPEREKLIDRVSESKYQDKFAFIDNCYGEEYKKELIKHHVIVLLSDYEGMPGTLMDGMSCGLIPISSNFLGVDELIENGRNGFIVENRHISLYNAINKLYNSTELRIRLSSEAKKTIINNFSIDKSFDKWQEFINLCNEKVKKKIFFKAQKKIKLPKFNPILIEDYRKNTPNHLILWENTFKKIIRKFTKIAFK
jgi:glycosyltransferase involved in cell wall biosynthesis